MLKYSIVVPFHNEQDSVTELYDRLKAVMEHVGESFEMIFVDDGSRDATFGLLSQIAAVDSRVVVVKLRRNFGQTSALAAGFDHAQGQFVIAMDGELQHDPAEIPKFVAKLNEGYDIVSGWREKRVDNLWLRRIPSRCANWTMSKLSGVELHDFGTTYKAYTRELIDDIPLYGEGLHRFIPALASWYGAKMCEVPIVNIERPDGTSHYGISRTIRVFFDLITIRFLLKYMMRPLHFFGGFGMAGVATGLLIAALVPLAATVTPAASHGDLIVAVDDQRIRTKADLDDAMARLRPGDTMYLTVVRPLPGGDHKTMKIRVKVCAQTNYGCYPVPDTASARPGVPTE